MTTQFHGNQTQAQIDAAINAGGFTQVSFSVVGRDSQYGAASVTVVLLNGSSSVTGYRVAQASIAAAKSYVNSLISTHNLSAQFKTATVDDGAGKQYTLAEVQAW